MESFLHSSPKEEGKLLLHHNDLPRESYPVVHQKAYKTQVIDS